MLLAEVGAAGVTGVGLRVSQALPDKKLMTYYYNSPCLLVD